jgi:hypothetical protein
MVGVEHQLWDSQDQRDGYSVFENTGKITLASGNGVIGIQIDTEALNEAGRTKHNNNQTKNSGQIIINSTNSIGIDFGEYQAHNYLPVDVTLGNISVNGSHNYGLRMKNLKNGVLPNGYDYYDDVTISGGAGKVIVGGTENVGIGVGKSLSSTPSPYTEAGNLNHGVLDGANPISNFFGVNVEVVGTRVVGFMRLADYSTNNANDFLLNAQTMGTFNIGTNATNSSLIRTDYRGIQIQKNITTTGTSGSGNTIAHANGAAQYIYNSAILTVNAGLIRTTGLAATSTTASTIVNVRNTGTIEIKEEGGIGIYVAQNARGENTGTLKVSGSKENTGVANFGNFTLSGTVNVSGTKSSGLYNHNAAAINGTTTIKADKGATGIYADAGTLTSSAGNNLVIEVDDTLSPINKGLAIYAKSNAIVNVQGAQITVKKGSAGIAAYTGASINLTNGSIEYDGDGYAVYSDGTGIINLTGADITLKGESVGLLLDMALGLPVITLNGTTIDVQSTAAIGVNIINQTSSVMDLDAGDTQVSQLSSALATALGSVTFTGVSGYTQAAVENGILNINTALNKATDSGPSGFYYRHFLAQALRLNVKADITANLSTAEATAAFNGQVSALEMSSSKMASGLSQTQINIDPAVQVIAGRTDAGAGAIGAFINYGQLTNSGLIEVERTARNQGGVGIVAVNGALANNIGTLEVYGEKGIGMFGLAYRQQGAVLLGREFGGKTGEGATKLENNGDITIFEKEGAGMYLLNNSAETALLPPGTPTTAIGVENKIGASIQVIEEDSTGIYAQGNGTLAQTTVTNDGTIEVGKNGVAIFAERGVDITKAGTLRLGEEGIGIVLDKTSRISDTSTIVAQAATTAGNKMVVALRSTSGVNDPAAQTLNLNINTSALDKGTAIYIWNRGAAGTTIASTGTLTIGTDGVGIYVENGHGSNTGNIALSASADNAVGMYTKNGGIINDTTGTIVVNKTGQLGMVGKTTAGILENKGTISLNAIGATGIFVSNHAMITDSSAGNIVFGIAAANSFGIAADNAQVILNGGTYTLDNGKNNIYVYGKNGSTITLSGALIVDGVSAGTAKSVGIYLDGSNNLSSSNILTAQNGIVGVYSKGGNTITGGSYTALGDKSIGIYLENGGTLNNIAVAASALTGENVVGIYANGGAITIGTGLAVNLAGSGQVGTGIYLANGATMTGGPISILNNSTTTNAGIYYTGTGTVSQGTDLNILGSYVVGIFADGGITVNNNQAIQYAGTNNVGAFIAGNSNYHSSSATDNVNTAASAGIYVADGKAVQSGALQVSVGTSAALMAKSDVAGKTANIENTGTVTVTNGVGMLLGDTGSVPLGIIRGKNTGLINLTTGSGTGVVVGQGNIVFDGTGGTIRVGGSSSVGMYLDGTAAGQVTRAGTIDLQNASAVGIFADHGAVVDFPVTFAGQDGIGIYANNGALLSGTIDASGTTDTIAVYLSGATGNTVSFGNNEIKVGQSSGGTALGILMNNLGAYTLQHVKISATGINAAAVAAVNGTILDYKAIVTANNGGVGLYVDATSTLNANGGTFNIGTNGIGAYIDGGIANIGTSGVLQINFTGTNGTGIYSANGATTTLGGNIVVTGFGSLSAVENGSQSNTGTLAIANGSVGLLGQYDAGALGYAPSYQLLNTGTLQVKTGSTGIAAIAKPLGTLPGAGDVLVSNGGSITVENAGSVGVYSDIADISNSGGTITVSDQGIGIYAKDNARVLDFGNIQVSKGAGAVLDGNVVVSASGTITVNSGDINRYSVGVFYRNVTSVSAIPTVNLVGSHAVALIIEGTGTVAYSNPITLGSPGTTQHDQIYLKVQGDRPTNTAITATATTVDVYGDQNIGVYGDTADLTVTNINVGASTASADSSKSSIGVYGNNSKITAGNVVVGNNSIGIYGAAVVASIGANNVTVGSKGIGIYADGSNTHGETITLSGTLTVGNGKGIGIYGTGIDVNVGSGIVVGEKGSVGIVSEEDGNVTIGGSVTVNAVTTANQKDGSVGVYKNGSSGSIMTSGVWNIGREGYGIYGEQSGAGLMNIQNSAVMNLGESGVGIYGNGNIRVGNSGQISTGSTNFNGDVSDTGKHLNSIGIYLGGGAQGENTATGTVDVLHSHSVGIYGTGAGTKFTNNGTINVDHGGTGILVKTNAIAINNGTINVLSDTTGAAGKVSVGMAAYDGAQIINTGTINARSGIGMYVGISAKVDNQGIINITNGTGITGDGTLINQGTINITGTGKDYVKGKNGEMEKGSVRIDDDGKVYLNGNYVGLGGTVIAKSDVIVNGAYLGLEEFQNKDIPVISAAGTITGDVRLLPSFVTEGNGIHWTIKDFTDYFTAGGGASKITVKTSPLYVTKATGKDLILYKRPYKDMVVGSQYDKLYDGLDGLFADDGSKRYARDFGILTGWHEYLEKINNIYGETAYNKAFSEGMSELRGDVYATIRKRMGHMEDAFDNAVEEVSNAYNMTKDSHKYAVVHTQGRYLDNTVGIDDYKYQVEGFVYMKEKEGRKYGEKWGWYLGFGVGRFEFEDGEILKGGRSKETVYGLRAGLQHVKNVDGGDTLRLITGIETGYNRHETDRLMEMDRAYRNKGSYDSYQVSLSNRLEKVLTRGYSHKVEVYGGVDLEYGRSQHFRERGDGVHLEVKGSEYYSVEATVGIKGEIRKALVAGLEGKISGEVGYGRELNESSYRGIKARVAEGKEDYYDLIRPKQEKGSVRGKVGLTIERGEKAGITLSVEGRKYDHKEKVDARVGVSFTYKFGI